ncbi:MAG: ATP-binding protein [Planctomycetaceae bacterium]|nr:ATP-binding protein [Planctomycetaceae bacterium]
MNLSVLERMVADGDLSIAALRYLFDCRGECERLDFKESLRLSTDATAAEFARDCLAMKNAGGGYLVIGVKDKTWEPEGLPSAFPYDTKLIRDSVKKCTGLDLDIHIVPHVLTINNAQRAFALILIRGPKKRSRRRSPSIVRADFHPKESYGLRRGDIFIRSGDSTVRVTSDTEFEALLEQLDLDTDEDALDLGQSASPFAIENGTYRLLELGFESYIGRTELRQHVLDAVLRDPRIWVINVHGPGGVGKSALVNWVTHKCYKERHFEAILQLTAKDTVLTSGGIKQHNRCLYSLDDLLDRILQTFQESTDIDTDRCSQL